MKSKKYLIIGYIKNSQKNKNNKNKNGDMYNGQWRDGSQHGEVTIFLFQIFYIQYNILFLKTPLNFESGPSKPGIIRRSQKRPKCISQTVCKRQLKIVRYF